MLPHPFKTDTWIEGDHSNGDNLCQEIVMPGSGTELCTLGVQPSMIEYASLTHIHQTQVHTQVRRLLNSEKVTISKFGALPGAMMPTLDAEALALKLISEHEDDLTQLDYSLDALRAYYGEETVKLFGSLAINQKLKEQGIMQSTTEQIAKLTQAQEYGTMSKDKKSLAELIGEAGEKIGQGDPGIFPGKPTQQRKPKRKKSKPKSNHIPNMQNKRTKSILGASILNMLGKVQQDTQDAYKRSLLKEIPLADLVEISTGETLPDYQANMLNGWQAKFDPNAPIVARVNASSEDALTNLERLPEESDAWHAVSEAFNKRMDTVSENVKASDELVEALYPGTLAREVARLSQYPELVDTFLKTYITPELFPDGADSELVSQAVEKVKQYFVDQTEPMTLEAVSEQMLNELDALGVEPPYNNTKVRAIRKEDGSKTYHTVIDADDPDPASTLRLVEHALTQPGDTVMPLAFESVNKNA